MRNNGSYLRQLIVEQRRANDSLDMIANMLILASAPEIDEEEEERKRAEKEEKCRQQRLREEEQAAQYGYC